MNGESIRGIAKLTEKENKASKQMHKIFETFQQDMFHYVSLNLFHYFL